ncbi:flagellar M-ring protein [Lysobacter xinjiangensis]|uniref:Flagellar M-ring protein n=1 Tax=Cognatilysobacter xinjiangensis TaxID=546892 RepID=A0ABQ3BPM1_9GAMM|nr:flagellar basal-body MS-ring/collar protein FliF [Lysobacter xinjiangensis]GGZ52809.1 flagellar M-ring protein [Lysobacter xinjiangensis]
MAVIALPKTTDKLEKLGRLQDIPAIRQVGMIALVAAAIAAGLWLFFWTQKPNYVPVYAGLDAKATEEAAQLLGTSQIPYRIDTGTGALAVPADQLGAAKMALASAGLPAGGEKGFESMQGDQGFGTSQFVENARYQHAMEVELARTIANLRPVREARVHLALPKPSAFTRDKQDASASVVLQLRTGSTLEQNQVDAIVNLVATSVPNLPTNRVTVVDQFGRMLSQRDPTSAEAVGQQQLDQQHRQEAVYVQRIEQLLEPMTGPGRISAQVSVDMDFDQTEEARETYGPDQIVRSEQTSESGDLSATGAAAPPQRGVPGSVSNTPVPPGTAPVASNAPAQPAQGTRNAVRNYEVDRTLTHKRQAPGKIRRVTAAVLVDNVPASAPGKDGKVNLRALTPAEQQRIQTLVQQAIGFNAERGDAVSVVNAPFARDLAAGDDNSPPIWQDPQARDLLRTILGGVAVIVLIFTVLRPAFRQMLQPKPVVPAQSTVATIIAEELEQEAAAPRDRIPNGGDPALPTAAMQFDQKLEVARSAVTNDPKRVAQVVRDMVAQDG